MNKREFGNVLNKVVTRLFGIQNLWNYKYMQLYGYIYSLLPLYRFLYTKEELKVRLLNQWSYFNTNPYMASYITAIHSKMLLLDEDEKDIRRMRNNLMCPLASIGDSFFWWTLRVFLIGVTFLFLVLFKDMSALLFVSIATVMVFFNIFHFYHRLWGFKRTFRIGRITLKFTKNFFFFERSVNHLSFLFFTLAISGILSELFKDHIILGDIKFIVIFIIFALFNIFCTKFIKNEFATIVLNLIISTLIVIWGKL